MTTETTGPALVCYVTGYEVGYFPPDDEGGLVFNLKVEYRGEDKWAVCKGGRQCLGSDGLWDWESIPSERTEEWLATHRFGLDEALDLARRHAPSIKVNGKTAAEAAQRLVKG